MFFLNNSASVRLQISENNGVVLYVLLYAAAPQLPDALLPLGMKQEDTNLKLVPVAPSKFGVLSYMLFYLFATCRKLILGEHEENIQLLTHVRCLLKWNNWKMRFKFIY